jgi:hypothetical protein
MQSYANTPTIPATVTHIPTPPIRSHCLMVISKPPSPTAPA